jgi:hypothetical protein
LFRTDRRGATEPTPPFTRSTNASAVAEVETESAQPAKIMRISSMVKQLLDEVRGAPLDEVSRTRLREIHELSLRELAGAVGPDLARELKRVTSPFSGPTPSESELLALPSAQGLHPAALAASLGG